MSVEGRGTPAYTYIYIYYTNGFFAHLSAIELVTTYVAFHSLHSLSGEIFMLMAFIVLFEIFCHVALSESLYKNLPSLGVLS